MTDRHGRTSRRQFLAALARAGIGSAAFAALPPWARTALAADLPEGLVVRNDRPEHWESTLDALEQGWITPNEKFFVRSHFGAPRLDRSSWQLEVTGRVATPLTLSLADVRALPRAEAVHTLECAGNGRALYRLPSTSGTQWERGAIGNAAWGGVRLANVLLRAGLAPEAKHVWFEAGDQAPDPAVPRFVRSIPLDKAMDDTLLAHTMNGEVLPELHGGPLRAVVPGWYGMASTKWLTRLHVEDRPAEGHFMERAYRYQYAGGDPEAAPPVEHLRVKSLILQPRDGALVRVAPPPGARPGAKPRLRVQGLTWGGPTGVRFVEVSIDAGRSWRPAGFMNDNVPGSWREWATELEVEPPRRLTVLARATDNEGAVQPMAARPNAGGYGNNSIQAVTVRVRAA